MAWLTQVKNRINRIRWERRELREILQRHPELSWRRGPDGPLRRVESSGTVLGRNLFLFGGYESLEKVHSVVTVFDLHRKKWGGNIALPEGCPETHNAVVNDGKRYLFSLSGQIGPQCGYASPACYYFDTIRSQWHPLPNLPEARYMPVAAYHNHRIHVMGGTGPDRLTVANEHWSLGFKDGCISESEWRQEPAMPLGRNHVAGISQGDRLYIFGGQAGDVPRQDRHSIICDLSSPDEVVFDDVWIYDFRGENWSKGANMPVPLSHTEDAVDGYGEHVILAGGIRKRWDLTDLVHAYHPQKDQWQLIGHLPYPMKSKNTAVYGNQLIILCGQHAVSHEDLRPGLVVNQVWYADLPKSLISG